MDDEKEAEAKAGADAEATGEARASENIALFDLDSTLADFDGGMEAAMREIATPSEISDGTYYPREQEGEPTYIRERRRLVKRQPGFWLNLKPLELGMTLLGWALDFGYRITILTNGPRTNFRAWSEKVEWCHKHLPMERGIQVHIGEDKGLVYGKILVDDWPRYIERWRRWRPRGLVLMPDMPWNRDYERPNVERVTLRELKCPWSVDQKYGHRFRELMARRREDGKS